MNKYSVTQFTKIISEVIDEAVPTAWIEGEVSRFKKYPSGHCYFTIKDENSSISAVIWGTYANKFPTLPKEGEKALFFGKAKVFEKRGDYQFTIYSYQPIGEGSINQNFEQLKSRLSQEGLFDQENKKLLSTLPERIAIVTGESSAALSDVLKVLKSNAPYVDVKLFYTVVQGDKNDTKIIDTLKRVENYSNKVHQIDTVLLVRGGGSVEDLWVFNSERLVRYIYNYSIPLISGIGHDIDYTLVDFVSDERAATPSVAADKCAMNIEQIWQNIDYYQNSLDEIIDNKIFEIKSRIENFNSKSEGQILSYKLEQLKSKLSNNVTLIDNKMKNCSENSKNRLNLTLQKIENYNPDNIFKLGFASVKAKKSGNLIKSVKNVEVGSDIKVIFSDGELFANILEIKED